MSDVQTATAGKGWFGSDRRRLLIQEYGIFIAFLVLVAVLALSNEFFLTAGNISNVLLQTSINGVLAIGMTFVIITAGIDVSVAAIIMVSAVTTAQLLVAFDIPAVAAVLVAILVGAALGAVNGFLIAYGRVHPIIITFGTANLFRKGVRFIVWSFRSGSVKHFGSPWASILPPLASRG